VDKRVQRSAAGYCPGELFDICRHIIVVTHGVEVHVPLQRDLVQIKLFLRQNKLLSGPVMFRSSGPASTVASLVTDETVGARLSAHVGTE
jgi:hypothetical protein